jgi:hypothetical protein
MARQVGFLAHATAALDICSRRLDYPMVPCRDSVAPMALTKLQAAGEFVESTAKVLADELTIVLLKEGTDLNLSGDDLAAFRYSLTRCGQLLNGLVTMALEMKQ